MIRAYNKLYLDDAMENLGEAFDYAVNYESMDIDEFLDCFCRSGIAWNFEHGDPKYVSGMSGIELYLTVCDKLGIHAEMPDHRYLRKEALPFRDGRNCA